MKSTYSKHKVTSSETDNILLPEKDKKNYTRRYTDSYSPYLPPRYTSISSNLQSPKETYPSN